MKPGKYEQNPRYPPPKHGEPPLHAAARLGQHECIRQLVGEGCDINLAFNMCLDPGACPMLATPLMVAAGSGYGSSRETMHILLTLGADPLRKGDAGTIARYAARGLGWNYLPGGDASRLRLCLELGCDPNETDTRGVTLLADAAKTGDVDRVKVLLEAGASPNASSIIVHTSPSSLKYLGKKYDNTAPWSFQIPLHNAVEVDEVEIVNLLLAAGADIDATEKGRETALFIVRSPEVARVLVRAGLDVEGKDCHEWSPLVNAVNDGSLEAVQALISVGADVNATHDRGFTVFMSAVGSAERNVEIMKALIEAGANAHAISELGWNAFHAAIDVNGGEANMEESIRSTLQFLLQLGVDINHKDAQGVSPLERARRYGTDVEVKVLLELGAVP
ncbi:MAG: ankyrin repeat domain-containing protein [Nitrospira sp.]|nr:ankyrin repeat domain-containing protein [Nitrospira sp.]